MEDVCATLKKFGYTQCPISDDSSGVKKELSTEWFKTPQSEEKTQIMSSLSSTVKDTPFA
jgi:hypothetical protein